MHCQQANELFSDYIEHALDPAMTVSVDNHLAACGSCREEVSALRSVWAHLDKMPLAEPPARLHAGIMDALDAHLQAEQQTAKPRGLGAAWNLRDLFRPRTLAYAATALVLALSSVELVQSQRAALGPLGMAACILHLQPNASDNAATLPAITATHAEWLADASGGGTLVLALKADPDKASALEALTYHVQLASDNGTPEANSAPGIQGHFDTSGVSTLRLPLPNGISGSRVRLALTFLSSTTGNKVAQQEIIVPVQR